jgi:hypothetical protein
VDITLAKPDLDRLTVNALDGDDILIHGLGQDDLAGGPGYNHPYSADRRAEAIADILNHCRGAGPHVRGCWVIDLVLGKS